MKKILDLTIRELSSLLRPFLWGTIFGSSLIILIFDIYDQKYSMNKLILGSVIIVLTIIYLYGRLYFYANTKAKKAQEE